MDLADEVVFDGVLVFDGDLDAIGLETISGEGEDLTENRVLVLLKMLGDAFIVPELDLDVGIQASGDVHVRESSSFHDVHVEELHLDDEIVGRRDLILGDTVP